MNDLIETIFGSSTDLTVLQMTSRGVVIFIIALALLRVSGRRSFGMRTPLDNIIVILLGAVLSRAVVGASPFVPVMVCSLAVVLLHRIFAWGNLRSRAFAELLQGKHILLFDDGKRHWKEMNKALISDRDLEQALRMKLSAEDFEKVQRMYLEHNGEISVIRKPSEDK